MENWKIDKNLHNFQELQNFESETVKKLIINRSKENFGRFENNLNTVKFEKKRTESVNSENHELLKELQNSQNVGIISNKVNPFEVDRFRGTLPLLDAGDSEIIDEVRSSSDSDSAIIQKINNERNTNVIKSRRSILDKMVEKGENMNKRQKENEINEDEDQESIEDSITSNREEINSERVNDETQTFPIKSELNTNKNGNNQNSLFFKNHFNRNRNLKSINNDINSKITKNSKKIRSNSNSNSSRNSKNSNIDKNSKSNNSHSHNISNRSNRSPSHTNSNRSNRSDSSSHSDSKIINTHSNSKNSASHSNNNNGNNYIARNGNDPVFSFLNIVKSSNFKSEEALEQTEKEQADENILLDIQFTEKSFEEEEEVLAPTLFDKIKELIRSFLNSKYFTFVFSLNVFTALFLESLKSIFFPIDWDHAVDFIMLTVFCFFIFEILIHFALLKSYRFSFFFYADVLSVCGLVSEVHIFFEHSDNNSAQNSDLLNIFIGNSHVSKTIRVTSSGSRISRVFTLFNVLGSLSVFQIGRLYKNNVDDFLEKTQMTLFGKKQKEHIRLMRRNTLTVAKMRDKMSFFKKLHSVVNLANDEEEAEGGQKRSIVNPIIIKNFYDYTMKNELRNRNLVGGNAAKNIAKLKNLIKEDKMMTKPNEREGNNANHVNNVNRNTNASSFTNFAKLYAKDVGKIVKNEKRNSLVNTPVQPPRFNIINYNITNINLHVGSLGNDTVNSINAANYAGVNQNTTQNIPQISPNRTATNLNTFNFGGRNSITSTANINTINSNINTNNSNFNSIINPNANENSFHQTANNSGTNKRTFSTTLLSRKRSTTLEAMRKMKTIIVEEKEEENEVEADKVNLPDISVKNKSDSDTESNKEEKSSQNDFHTSIHSQQSNHLYLCECGPGLKSKSSFANNFHNQHNNNPNLVENHQTYFQRKASGSKNANKILNQPSSIQRRNSFIPKFSMKKRFSLISKDVLSKINVENIQNNFLNNPQESELSSSPTPADRKTSIFWNLVSGMGSHFEGAVRKCDHCGGMEIINPALDESIATYLDDDEDSRRSSIDFGGGRRSTSTT